MGLSAQIVHFVGLDLLHQPDKVHGVGQITVVQEKSAAVGMGVLIKMIDAAGVVRGSPALDAVNFIAMRFKACTEEIAKEVLKKPMSYLTKAHDQEILDLQNLITSLEADHSDIYEMLIKKYRAVKTKMLKEINENVTIFVNN